MISSVFGKTKPINHVLVLSFISLVFILSKWRGSDSSISASAIPSLLLALAVLLFSVLLLNFIVQRNQLTAAHGYSYLFFGVLCAGFSGALRDNAGIFAFFFFLLAMRRLLSLQSLKRIHSKLFDGTLWILVSSLFVNWTLILLPLCFIFLYVYQPKVFRNWLVPFVALGVFLLIGYGATILMGRPDALWEHYASWSWQALEGSEWKAIGIKQALYLILVLMALGISFIKQGKTGHGKLLNLRLLVLTFVLSLAAGVLWKPLQEGALLFSFFPASVFISRYIETIKRVQLKDAMLWTLFVLGLLGFLWETIIK